MKNINEKIDLTVIGHTAIDNIIIYNRDEILPGGSAPAVAISAAKNGIKVGLLTMIGKDFPYKWLKLLEEYLDTSGIYIDGTSTRIKIIYSNEGNIENIDISLNISNRLKNIYFPSHYLEAKFIHICPLPISDQLKIINNYQGNAMISTDFNNVYEYEYRKNPRTMKKIIGNSDIIFPNEFEANMITGTDDVKESAKILYDMGTSFVVIKLGTKGSILYDGDNIKFFPPCEVSNIVDPTGCGDAFIGGFMSTYIKTGDIDISMKIANIIAAKKITKKGSWMIDHQ